MMDVLQSAEMPFPFPDSNSAQITATKKDPFRHVRKSEMP